MEDEHQLIVLPLTDNAAVVNLGVYWTQSLSNTLPLSLEEPFLGRFWGGLVSVSPSRVAL